MVSFDNLYLAFKKAARGKRSKPDVAAFEFHLEPNLLELQERLRAGVYQPGGYHSFYIHDPKRRLISAADFCDRVVHHALVNILQPIYERKFIHDTYANRVGKGSHKALDRCTYFMRRFDYLLPLDLRQYFPAIDHAVLMDILGETIADERVLDLCGRIIESGREVLQAEYEMIYFPGDDLFAATRPRGLPIGNMTSQFWANVYLNGLDHFIKRELKCRGYLRYVDDMLLFSNDKRKLHAWRARVSEYLAGLRLTIHANRAQPRPCRAGVPFLGFQVFPDHRRLKRPKVVQARRRLKARARQYSQGQIERERLDASVQGWVNHARYGDTWGLRGAVLAEVSALSFKGGGDERRAISDLQQDL
jgi:retron-type reverse transcriptase